MQTLVALDKCLDEDQRQMTEAVRPSSQELVVARRQLHRKAAVIAVLAITAPHTAQPCQPIKAHGRWLKSMGARP
ncbi:MAG: hypothetical protein ABI862_02875 [Ilumatobacteraceae bacterium]